MIIYNKLGKILKKRSLSWKDLRNAGLSQNMPTRFSKNESISSDTTVSYTHLDVYKRQILHTMQKMCAETRDR